MKEAKTIEELMAVIKDDIVIKFMNEDHKVTHKLWIYWDRKNGFPILPQEVLKKEVKFFVNDDINDFIVYC